ncbi:MAG: type II secretion system F family protein [Archaeoglobaceae archaeon]|nr:type II secretion system F family protein [Archaeoglobaceae archaeon]MCX8152022.1 type II secretion system F family protein [Archaeoglobaceae archaeon]MDW8013411.1 type II secretion system F family protein [Archaeoglobaceae archaeon]
MFSRANYLTYLGYKFFGDYIKKNKAKYYEIERSLKKASIPLPPEMYIATARMFSLIFGFVGSIIGVFLAFTIIYFTGIPPIFSIVLPPGIAEYWLGIREFVYASIVAVAITLAFYYFANFLFSIYPALIISDRKSKIDRVLPHAITFMYSLSRGGMNLLQIFKSLSENYEVYGEVSREASKIVWKVEVFGSDLRTALAEMVDVTPSESFREFLHGLITIIDSGGDVTMYLEERANFYFEKTRQNQKGFLEFLGLMAETYITALVAGPLFLIVILTVMSVLGHSNDVAILSVIYLVIPIGSFMFAVVIKLLTPGELGKAPILRERFVYFSNVSNVSEKGEVKEIKKLVKIWKIKKKLKRPIKLLIENPYATFVLSLPLGVMFIVYGLLINPVELDLRAWFFKIDDYIFIALVIILAPFTLFFELNKRSTSKFMRLTPIFLNKLASANESGLPIHRAIEMLARTDTSPLRKEIAKIKRNLDWGISLTDALARFANRLRIFEITRTITLLREALISTGNVTEVLMISAKDASNAELLRRERAVNMFSYVIIVYIAFFVFIGIVYIISSTFLSTLAEAAAKVQATGQAFTFLSSVDVYLYRNYFMHAAVFQGIFAGLVAGAMGEGSLSAGVKHSLLMLIVAYVVFNVLFSLKLV